MWIILHVGYETKGTCARPKRPSVAARRRGWHVVRMLELTQSHRLGPDTARAEIRRAMRIKASLTRPADERALQGYIDELEAYLARAEPR